MLNTGPHSCSWGGASNCLAPALVGLFVGNKTMDGTWMVALGLGLFIPSLQQSSFYLHSLGPGGSVIQVGLMRYSNQSL